MGSIARTIANQIGSDGKLNAAGLDLADDYTFTGTVEGAGGGIFESQLLHIQDQKANGTAAGSASAATTQTRDLNTVVTNEITGASLSSDVITLPSGTFYIFASAPAFALRKHKANLYNTADSSVELVGTSEHTAHSDRKSITRSFIIGRFTISSQKTFEIRHYTDNAVASFGLGEATSSGNIEIYTDVQIWKVA